MVQALVGLQRKMRLVPVNLLSDIDTVDSLSTVS